MRRTLNCTTVKSHLLYICMCIGVSLPITALASFCDLNTYVENDDMTQTFNCMKNIRTVKGFDELADGCQKRCFLLLRQIQRQKVKRLLKRQARRARTRVILCTIVSNYLIHFCHSATRTAALMSRMSPLKVIKSTSI